MGDPSTAELAAVYLASGTETGFMNESMAEVDDTANGHQRYTVYEILDPDRRNLCLSQVPTFQKKVHGAGSWLDITGNIEYPGGRLVLSTPLNPDDLVQLASGKYYTPSQVLGGTVSKVSRKNLLELFSLMGEEWVRRHLVGKDFSISLDSYVMANCAEHTTSGGNPHSHFTCWHEGGGVAGNSLRIRLVNPGTPSQALSVVVSGNDITVNLATNAGSAIISTGQNVVVALEANAFVRTLGFRSGLADGETGAGIVAAFAYVNLAGGADPEDFTGKDAVLIVQVYKNEVSDERLEGYCWIEDVNVDLAPMKLIKEALTIQGHGKLYRRY